MKTGTSRSHSQDPIDIDTCRSCSNIKRLYLDFCRKVKDKRESSAAAGGRSAVSPTMSGTLHETWAEIFKIVGLFSHESNHCDRKSRCAPTEMQGKRL